MVLNLPIDFDLIPDSPKGMRRQIINCLTSYGITTWGDLTRMTRRELLEVRNLGKKGVDLLESAVHSHNMKLGQRAPDALRELAELEGTQKSLKGIITHLHTVVKLLDTSIEGLKKIVLKQA